LTPAEVAGYVRTRLERAGAPDVALFAEAALERVAALSLGIPRVINVLCDAALMTAFATGASHVTPSVIDEVWRDYAPAIGPESLQPPAPVIGPAAAMARLAEPLPPLMAMNGAPELPAPEAPPAETTLPLVIAQPEAAPVVVETPTPAVPVAASAPAPSGDTVSISPRTRHAFSIPAAAACIGALAVLLYALSPSGKDADVPATAAPAPVIARGPRPRRSLRPSNPARCARRASSRRRRQRAWSRSSGAPTRHGTSIASSSCSRPTRPRTARAASTPSPRATAACSPPSRAELHARVAGDRPRVRRPRSAARSSSAIARWAATATRSGSGRVEVRRREGRPLITALTYRLDPQS